MFIETPIIEGNVLDDAIAPFRDRVFEAIANDCENGFAENVNELLASLYLKAFEDGIITNTLTNIVRK